ncbi:hypothetical protein ACSFA3_20960 [Variovorax sp. RHLX14]|uniref:hypothetical protein n=1 Tax=Variovorax sp. RHLX14 TaxID=1259731 RepID=UPI003F463AC8
MSTTDTHPLAGDGAPTHEPRVLFAAAAERAGLIRPGDPLDQNLVDYALEIVTLAARIADRYASSACHEDTVGDAIRGHLYEV